jgi:beta-glucosidase
VACDHYHHWPADLDLLRGANLDAYRFSTSWARVMPDGVTVNPEGLDFYDRLVDGMLERGLRPFLTLYHWDLPSALADLGGWTNRDTTARFADYAEVVARRLGDRVATIATINEPWCVAWLSHFLGVHAPGLRDIRAAARAMHHILLAHGRAVERLRGIGIAAPLGIVLNFDHATPASDSPEDRAAAARQDAIFNRWFIEGITRQTYPGRGDGGAGAAPARRLARRHGPDRAAAGLAGRQLLHPPPPRRRPRRPLARHPRGARPPAENPDGMGDLSAGPAWLSDPTGARPCRRPAALCHRKRHGQCRSGRHCPTTAREAYLADHLNAARQAIADGANLKGFFYWSLLDNYEWAEGYEKRFGLVHVDYQSLKRTPKSSYHALARALARNA